MQIDLQPVWIITRREIRDQFRDWRIVIPILALTLIFPAIMNFTAAQAVRFVERFGAELIGERLIPFLLMVVGFFPISVSLVIALESFVGEKERRSIEPLLASPLNDWHLYLGKLLAVIVPPLLAAYLGIGVYLIGIYRQIGWSPEPTLLVQILALTTIQAFLMVCGAVVISTQATSVRAANLLASFIIIPMAFLIQGEAMVMFWAQYDVLWWVVFGLVVASVLLLRMGISHFNREELLGRELDTLNLRASLNLFWSALRGDSSTLPVWYRRQVFPALRRMGQPALFVSILAVLFVWLGSGQAQVFPIPPEVLDLNRLEIETFTRLGEFSLLEAGGIAQVWWHNLRAVMLAMVLGIVTLGVFGVVVLLLPIMLIGYFLGVFAAAGVDPLRMLAAFILPHGILEIPAIVLAGAGLLYLGGRLVAPSNGRTIGEEFVLGMAEWAKVFLGVIAPMFLGAAILEVFVTPRVVLLLF